MATHPAVQGQHSVRRHDHYPPTAAVKNPAGFWWRPGWLFRALSLCAFSLLALSATAARALPLSTESTAESTAPTHESSGHMLFQNADGSTKAAPLLQTNVELWVNGMITTTTYRQTFHNNSADWVEGRYVFPLPETAAVNGMTMHIGERIIVGEIKEKQQARKIYQAAKTAGQRVSLVEQQRPNLFSQTVANIAPGEQVQVTLTYREVVHYEQGNFSLRLPLTITPRYIPGVPKQAVTRPELEVSSSQQRLALSNPKAALPEPKRTASEADIRRIHLNQQGWGWGRPTAQVADAALITPPMTLNPHLPGGAMRNPVSITIHLQAGLPLARIDSPYHDIVIHKHGDEHTISLSEGQVAMDRDFVLTWQPIQQKAPHAALFTEHRKRSANAESPEFDAGSDYLLLMLLPPQTPAHPAPAGERYTPALPREITFIVDTSGSMAGTSMAQAKASLQLALATLGPHDRFNLVEFNSDFRRFSTHSLPATDTNLRQARAFVAALHASGGTEMYAPLNAVLSATATEGFLKQVIFITDGSVGNEATLFALIERQLDQARLFTVGIGSAPNSYFMRKSAQFGRGTFTHVGNLAQVSEKMSALFRQLQTPLLRDIQVDWPEGIAVEAYPIKAPDLYRGQPLLIKAKLTQSRPRAKTSAQPQRANSDSPGTITVSGLTASGPWARTLSIPAVPRSPVDNPDQNQNQNHSLTGNGVGSLWGREKISALMDQIHTGVPPAEVKPQLLEVALTHQLLSVYTSFIAVDKTPVRPPETPLTSTAIPNLLAEGQKSMPHTLLSNQPQPAAQYSAHSYPQTALGLNGQVLLGTLSALLALVLLTAGRLLQPGSLPAPAPAPRRVQVHTP